MKNQAEQQPSKFPQILFWLLWIALLIIIPFYGFTLLFELSAVHANDTLSYLSPVIGVSVFIAQVTVIIRSFLQARGGILLSKAYLTLLGGSLIIGLIWAGGCATMGNLKF